MSTIVMIAHRPLDVRWRLMLSVTAMKTSHEAKATLDATAGALLTDPLQHLLATDPDPCMRLELASTPDLLEPLQRLLATDPSPLVRRALARNEHVAASAQAVLARDPDDSIRRALASNPVLAPALQALLVFGDAQRTPASEEVLTALAANPSVLLAQALPVSALTSTSRGRERLDAELGGVDPEVRKAFEPGFTGTLKEYQEVLGEFA